MHVVGSVVAGIAFVSCTATTQEPFTAEVRQRLELIRAATYPARYRFTYQPTAIELLECLVAPNPDLVGEVDTSQRRMSIQPTNEPDRTIIVTDSSAFLPRSMVDPGAPTAWLTIEATADQSVKSRARELLGAGAASFTTPPRMPPDPNDIVLSGADAASTVSVLAPATVDGAAVDQLRIVTDPTKAAEQITADGGPASNRPADRIIIDAAFDAEGRVVRLDIGIATGSLGNEQRDPAKASYAMTFDAFGTATPAPLPPIAETAPFTASSITSGTAAPCTVKVDPRDAPPTTGRQP